MPDPVRSSAETAKLDIPMEPAAIIDWALAHGFRQTGSNAYSAVHEGMEYQMLLRKGNFCLQKRHAGRVIENHARCDYANLRIDEHGMLLNAGLCESFVRRMWRGSPAPVWFTAPFTDYAREIVIPAWEAAVTSMGPR